MSYKDNVDSCSKLKSAEKLLAKLKKLIIIYKINLYYTSKLQKRAHNRSIKPRNYIVSNKVWLNSKYIKMK